MKFSCTSFINLNESVDTVHNFGISNLSISVFKLAKLVFKAKELISTWVVSCKSFLLHDQLNLIQPEYFQDVMLNMVENICYHSFIQYHVYLSNTCEFFLLHQLLLVCSLH